MIAEFTLGPTEMADFLLEHVDKEHPDTKDFGSFITEVSGAVRSSFPCMLLSVLN